jgi:hypothetical protein
MKLKIADEHQMLELKHAVWCFSHGNALQFLDLRALWT